MTFAARQIYKLTIRCISYPLRPQASFSLAKLQFSPLEIGKSWIQFQGAISHPVVDAEFIHNADPTELHSFLPQNFLAGALPYLPSKTTTFLSHLLSWQSQILGLFWGDLVLIRSRSQACKVLFPAGKGNTRCWAQFSVRLDPEYNIKQVWKLIWDGLRTFG